MINAITAWSAKVYTSTVLYILHNVIVTKILQNKNIWSYYSPRGYIYGDGYSFPATAVTKASLEVISLLTKQHQHHHRQHNRVDDEVVTRPTELVKAWNLCRYARQPWEMIQPCSLTIIATLNIA